MTNCILAPHLQALALSDGTGQIHGVVTLVARTQRHHVTLLAVVADVAGHRARAVVQTLVVILTPADDEGLVLLGSKMLQGIDSLHVVVVSQIICHLRIQLLLLLRRARLSQYQLGIGSHTAQLAAVGIPAMKVTLVVHVATCSDAGTVGGMRTVVILHFQRVENDVRVGKIRTCQRQRGGLALIVCHLDTG